MDYVYRAANTPARRTTRHYRLLIITYCFITTSALLEHYFRQISPIFRNAA